MIEAKEAAVGLLGAQRADIDADFHGRGARQYRRRAACAVGRGRPRRALPKTVASGRLPLSGRRVISRVPPCLCNEHLAWRLGDGRSTIVTDARGRTGPRTRNERNCTINTDQ